MQQKTFHLAEFSFALFIRKYIDEVKTYDRCCYSLQICNICIEREKRDLSRSEITTKKIKLKKR